MATLKERIIEALSHTPGLTDRELTNVVLGREKPQQSVNQECRFMQTKGYVIRQGRVNWELFVWERA